MSGAGTQEGFSENEKQDRKMVSLRLTRTAREQLRAQASAQGISQAAHMELLLRQAQEVPPRRK